MKQFAAAVYDAAVHFNVGNLGTLLLYDKMNIDRGFYTTKGCLRENKTRISNALRKSSSFYQDRRKRIRGEKKLKLVRNKTTEGKVYEPGMDD